MGVNLPRRFTPMASDEKFLGRVKLLKVVSDSHHLVMDVGDSARVYLFAKPPVEQQWATRVHSSAMFGPTRLPRPGRHADVKIAVTWVGVPERRLSPPSCLTSRDGAASAKGQFWRPYSNRSAPPVEPRPVAPSYVSDLERGTRNPSIKALARLATTLQVEPFSLLQPPQRR